MEDLDRAVRAGWWLLAAKVAAGVRDEEEAQEWRKFGLEVAAQLAADTDNTKRAARRMGYMETPVLHSRRRRRREKIT